MAVAMQISSIASAAAPGITAVKQIPGLPPAHVVWIDAIPRTHTGKIQRDQLQAMARGSGAL